jgi:DNA-binding CsgD family transcriptional regulator
MTTASSIKSTALMHLDTEARAARNLRTAEAVTQRNARIIRLAHGGQSTATLARIAQLAPSTIRAIVRTAKK